jgi:hypothetical protein
MKNFLKKIKLDIQFMFYFIDYVVIVIYIIFGNRFSYKKKKEKNINLVKTYYYLQLDYIKFIQ